MSSPITDTQCLQKLKGFANFQPAEMDLIATVSDIEDFKKGDLIVKEGESGDSMYVILSGEVQIFSDSEGKHVQLAKLSTGSFFGELALVDTSPRSASVIAEEDGQLLRIAQTTIGVLAGASPRAAIKLLVAIGHSLASRLRVGNKKYSNLILLGHEAQE
ncbi:MAG: cyclic nucleotide-binding domain-containing protein [Chthoniobacterales bacterium]